MRYHLRDLEFEACPAPDWAGEMAVIIGPEFYHVDAALFHALCEPLGAVATDPVTVPETAVVVIAPVPALPTSAHWSSAEGVPEPAPRLALGKGRGKYHGGPWVCETCSHVVPGGRKCDACGATHPKLLAARPSPRIHRSAVAHG